MFVKRVKEITSPFPYGPMNRECSWKKSQIEEKYMYSINWPNFMVCVPLFFKISGNICIVIVCFPVCDVINFGIYLSFLIKSLSCMTKKSGQLTNEKSFSDEMKNIIYHFSRTFIEVKKTNFSGSWESDFKNREFILNNFYGLRITWFFFIFRLPVTFLRPLNVITFYY